MLESMPFTEQLLLMQRVGVLVHMHGSAGAHVVVLRRGSVLFELRPYHYRQVSQETRDERVPAPVTHIVFFLVPFWGRSTLDVRGGTRPRLYSPDCMRACLAVSFGLAVSFVWDGTVVPP